MEIRAVDSTDLDALLTLTVTVFGEFYEQSFRPLAGETVFHNRHGDYPGDYRRMLTGINDPDQGNHAVLAQVDGEIAGYVGWTLQPEQRHGEIEIVAVAPACRRHGIGGALARHAMAHLESADIDVISLGTGGDDFHAPARALYESLGFTPFPTVSYTKPV